MTAIRPRSPEATILTETLRAVPAGATVEYRDLTKRIGVDVQTTGRALLYVALNALGHDGIWFHTIRDVGLMRATDDSLLGEERDRLLRARRAARRWRRRLVSVRYEALKPERQRRWEMQMTLCSIQEAMTYSPARRALEGKISDAELRLSRKATLAALPGGSRLSVEPHHNGGVAQGVK